LPPLPPGAECNDDASTVSPERGRELTLSVRSMFTLPTTQTLAIMPTLVRSDFVTHGGGRHGPGTIHIVGPGQAQPRESRPDLAVAPTGCQEAATGRHPNRGDGMGVKNFVVPGNLWGQHVPTSPPGIL
jgi:hypothetical protein